MDAVIFAAGLTAHAFVGDSLSNAKFLGEYLNKLNYARLFTKVCGLLKDFLNTSHGCESCSFVLLLVHCIVHYLKYIS